jgi:hypothetical protein
MPANLAAPPVPYRPWHGIPRPCEHEDWDRSICDWVRCEGTASWIAFTNSGIIRVCDDDVVYYSLDKTT